VVTSADNEPPKVRPKPPNAGKGRVAGIPNRTTAAIKDAILKAFDKVGGEDYLVRMARTEPKAFLTLLGRLVPTQLHGELDIRAGLADMLAAARARSRERT
jgi:hypothetical protein